MSFRLHRLLSMLLHARDRAPAPGKRRLKPSRHRLAESVDFGETPGAQTNNATVSATLQQVKAADITLVATDDDSGAKEPLRVQCHKALLHLRGLLVFFCDSV